MSPTGPEKRPEIRAGAEERPGGLTIWRTDERRSNDAERRRREGFADDRRRKAEMAG